MRQQNTLYSSKIPFTASKYPLPTCIICHPKVADFCENNLLKLLIGSKSIKECKSLICGRRVKHSINLDNARNYLLEICPFWGKGYFAAKNNGRLRTRRCSSPCIGNTRHYRTLCGVIHNEFR